MSQPAGGGKTGIIEKITIRKVQLRDLNGAVYTVPFSEITIEENLTKDFSYYIFNVGVSYRESPDEVIELLKGISAVIIKARIKTLPIQQWAVGREFNRRMKYFFDEHNVEIPFPHQTVYFGENKDGNAPPAHLALDKTPQNKRVNNASGEQ